MKAKLSNVLLGVMLLAILSPLDSLYADQMKRTFPAVAGGALKVVAEGAGVKVTGGTVDQVNVTLDSPREIGKFYDVTLGKEGDAVVISVKAKDSDHLLSRFFGNNLPGLEITVSVPAQTNADINTSGGEIGVSGLEGSVVANTSGGGVDCSRIVGPVVAHTSGGSINLVSVTGTYEVETSGGSIEAEGLSGDGSLETSGGGISAKRCTGMLDAGTSGGSIEVSGHSGGLIASTSGGNIDVEFTSPPARDSALRTAGGSITLAVPPQSGAWLSAKTIGGSVTTDLAVQVQGTIEGSSIEGRMGEGGPKLTLKTVGGSIRITKNEI